MGRDKAPSSGGATATSSKSGKGKGKGAASGGDGAALSSKGGTVDKLKTCTQVKARHILYSKEAKILEIYEQLRNEYGDTPPPTAFAKLAEQFSECSSGKKGGDLGWFPRGKMVGQFQDVAFATPKGRMSAPVKTTHGYHLILVEDRKA